jgi:hypothetical protein
MLCQAKPSAAGPTVNSWVGGERRLCGKGELAGSRGKRFLAAGGSQLPVECSMLLPMLLEVRKNNYRSEASPHQGRLKSVDLSVPGG